MHDKYPLPKVDQVIIDEVCHDITNPDFFVCEDAELLRENPAVYKFLSDLAAKTAPEDLALRAQVFRVGQAIIEIFARQTELENIENQFALAAHPHPYDQAA